MIKLKLLAGLSAALISVSLMGTAARAEGDCRDYGTCPPSLVKKAHYKSRLHARMVQGHVLSRKRTRFVVAFAAMAPRGRGTVVAVIKAQAPRYGVPTWFALRIAQIESGFNPRARGSAGEYGVFQLKCATARGIGFRGNCSNLLNAATNIQFGLKHLSLAVRGSRGNLKLAASKHNGGLGRKSIVPSYVNRVF